MELIRQYLNGFILDPYKLKKDVAYKFRCREAEDPYGPQFMEVTGIFQYYYGPEDTRMSRFKDAIVIKPCGEMQKCVVFEYETLFMFATRISHKEEYIHG